MILLIGARRKAGKTLKNETLLHDIKTELSCMEEKLLLMDGLEIPMGWDIKRIISSGGKRLRPILAYLCYRLGGSRTLPIQPLMSMLELMHTASLIHDDVVDNAELRRGCETINASSGRAAAVQSGDYLLAKAMDSLHYYKGTGINEALIQASTDMCLGELMQLKVRCDADAQTRAFYEMQIFRKTGSLIGASCYTGSIAGGLTDRQASMLKSYGEHLGIAFQLVDDLLDYSLRSVFGKTPGQDLKNGIYTLPVLHQMEVGVPASVEKLIRKKDKDEGDIRRLIVYMRQTGSVEYAQAVVKQKSSEAIDALRGLAESMEKTALVELALQLADRQS